MADRQTPSEYLKNYHGMYFYDMTLGHAICVDMRLYVSGSDLHADYAKVIQRALPFCAGTPGAHPKRLRFDGDKVAALVAKYKLDLTPDQVETVDDWNVAGLKRAYMGRGSPQEVFDATRLAIYTGVTTLAEADTYVTKTFGQDCNAFVGNYLGLSPMVGIGYYCEKWRPKNDGDETRVAGASAWCPAISDPTKIEVGDIFVVWGSLDSRGMPYRHVGLVDGFTPGAPTVAKAGSPPVVASGTIDRAEWGKAGGWDAHYKTGQRLEFVLGTKTPWPPAQPAIYAKITDAALVKIYGSDARLYFLSTAAIRSSFQPRFWEVAGRSDL